jgi:GNAT superfamily N-acetyltransferase
MNDDHAAPISIRTAEANDYATVAELRWQWVLENEGTPVVSHDEFLTLFVEWARANRGTHSCVVACRGETVIGMAWLAAVPRVPSSRAPVRASGDVQCVYVVPAERDAGVGGRMLAAVLARAREAGLERVTVQSTAGAVTAYERAGFAASARLLQATLTP